MLDGDTIFNKHDAKYFEFLKTKIELEPTVETETEIETEPEIEINKEEIKSGKAEPGKNNAVSEQEIRVIHLIGILCNCTINKFIKKSFRIKTETDTLYIAESNQIYLDNIGNPGAFLTKIAVFKYLDKAEKI